MQVCTSRQTDNYASMPPLSFLQTGCPSCRPTNSVKALKASVSVCPTGRMATMTKHGINYQHGVSYYCDAVSIAINEQVLRYQRTDHSIN